ncbi:hypothetical protein EDC91_10139 [Shewanella fodinae]|uniref:Uncharacterized protein n=1 Tax=Shewanella fodinae TaxID=552357 RepID=A0A4R2FJQ0_9GAMM|nr:hypothetical protein EDC91_10139 [Shewanella fodinae]
MLYQSDYNTNPAQCGCNRQRLIFANVKLLLKILNAKRLSSHSNGDSIKTEPVTGGRLPFIQLQEPLI